MSYSLELNEWAQENFRECELGDKRRTERLVTVASQVASNPAGSFPEQMPTWGDLKAAYNLFDREEVTFAAIAGPHWENTRRRDAGRYLVICDTTELDFGIHRDIDGLGPTGNGRGYGFFLHNALMVDAATEEIVGVAGQTIHYRRHASKKENRSRRMKRERESKVWGDVVDAVGRPSEEVEFIHVCDRGGDNFELFCHMIEQQSDWVVRASQTHRLILTPDDEEMPLSDYLTTLPLAGTYELDVRARKGQRSRTAKLEVRFGKLRMPVPKHKSPYVKKLAPEPIEMSVVHVREVNAPKDTEPIEWVLYTSLPVITFDDAWIIITYYEARWLVEEYHKALKTGCRVTHRQLKSPGRLEAMVGLMSVVAVRLLQLKSVARTAPDRPAQRVVPRLWLDMLKAARKNLRRVHDLTVGEFYREVAKLGGFLGRKGDGEPGWITIWRGWEKLNTLVRAVELAAQLRPKTRRSG
jgi:hypothetical protein